MTTPEKVFAFVNDDDNIELRALTVNPDSAGMVSRVEYESNKANFKCEVLAELVKMDNPEYRATHGAEFLRKHSVWLHNLAKSGFALEYSQFVKD
jgi:hypothetical protein